MTPEEKFARLRDDSLWNEIRMPRTRAVEPAERSRIWQFVVPLIVGIVVAALVVVSVNSLRATSTLQPAVLTPTSTITAEPNPEPVPTPVEGEFLSAQESIAAWKYDVYTFPRELPAELQFPTSPPTGWFDEGSFYGAGITATQVAGHWVCAWEREYLDASEAGDEPRTLAAMAQIDAYASLPAIVSFYPDEPVWREMTIAPALVGDLDPMRSDIANRCSTPLSDIDAASN
jgi:hypothetical protein